MNYFAHGRHVFDRPYVLAGTAVPDWLGVCDRKARVRRRIALERWESLRFEQGKSTELVAGIVRHFEDDDWFHRTPAFIELSAQFALRIRDFFPEDRSMRASFLGHILTEMLLDAVLIERDADGLDAYYAALGEIDPQRVEAWVNEMNRKPTDRLAILIRQFRDVRFLADYGDDRALLFRLNQVMRRVRLATLPDSFCRLLPDFRASVAQQTDALLTPPQAVFKAVT